MYYSDLETGKRDESIMFCVFRDSLHSHEKELERTSSNIKELIKEVKNLITTAKNLSKAQRSLASHLINFRFDCIGSNQTDDELVIAGSLKEFGRLINTIEDERDRMLDRAHDNFIVPLETFRKEHVGSVKERKKKFDKQTAKFCASQERYLGLSTKKQDNVLQEVGPSKIKECQMTPQVCVGQSKYLC